MKNSLTHTTLNYPVELMSMSDGSLNWFSRDMSFLPLFTTHYDPQRLKGCLLESLVVLRLLPLNALKTIEKMRWGSKGSRGKVLFAPIQIAKTTKHLGKPRFSLLIAGISVRETFPELILRRHVPVIGELISRVLSVRRTREINSAGDVFPHGEHGKPSVFPLWLKFSRKFNP